MKISLKYVGILVGSFLVLSSFFFFGRHHNTYNTLLLSGIVTAFLSFAMIMFGKHSARSKFIAFVVVFLCAAIEQLLEPILIDASYKTFIKQNATALMEINRILGAKPGDIIILNEDIKDDSKLLTSMEKQRLIDSKQKLGVYLISKSDKSVYYGLWGFLDVRLGVSFWIDKLEPPSNYRHLTGAWYH
jgi:hypothetical protein